MQKLVIGLERRSDSMNQQARSNLLLLRMMLSKKSATFWHHALVILLGLTFSGVARAQAPTNDFPTSARADYVYACMKVNGETREVLNRCSCSVDLIATIIPYEKYEQAETFLELGQQLGENGSFYRNSPTAKTAVGDLKRAQAEAEMRCF